MVFSLKFITDEATQCENIKDKSNRKNVTRILKRIKSVLTDIRPSDNGHLVYLGINSAGVEICELITPPNPVLKFTYYCGKEFITEPFRELFDTKPVGYVIFISGDECLIYSHTGITWNKLKSLNGNLIKRHNKGGQSSVRFSRLAEESRHHYIVYCSDYIRQLIPDRNVSLSTRVYVYGSDELKTKLMAHPTLKDYTLMTGQVFYSFTVDTIKDKYFNDLFAKSDFNGQSRNTELVELINTAPDRLLFTLAEICDNLEMVEYICVCQPKIYDLSGTGNEIFTQTIQNKTMYILDISSSCYSVLKDYQIIAKLFYVPEPVSM
jgi:hypothetical protein